MPAGLKTIKTRIKSIQNIKKITKAMEMVSVSKMKRATASVLATRPYAEECWRVLDDLSRRVDPTKHPLLFASDRIRRILVVVMSSDRGLCGNFNTEIMQKIRTLLSIAGDDVEMEFVSIGKKAQDAMVRRAYALSASFSGMRARPSVQDIAPVSLLIKDKFLKKEISHAYLIYTDFVSTIKQHAVLHQLLPLKKSEELGEVDTKHANLRPKDALDAAAKSFDFVFEPKSDTVLEYVLPRLIEIQIFQALLESVASEHAARMVAMRSASDAASDIVGDLTLSYNQVRQAGITREIAEISAGKAVLE